GAGQVQRRHRRGTAPVAQDGGHLPQPAHGQAGPRRRARARSLGHPREADRTLTASARRLADAPGGELPTGARSARPGGDRNPGRGARACARHATTRIAMRIADASPRAAQDERYDWCRDGNLPMSREDRIAEAFALVALMFSMSIGLVIALLPA